MKEEQVVFYSGGERVVGDLYLPDTGKGEPGPAVVQGPGWMGLRTARLYRPYHEPFLAAGIVVLVIDYRGCGDSDGDPLGFSPRRQLEDLTNAVTYLTTRPEVDPDRIGVFGSGGTGGGNAVCLAATDQRVRCAVAQVPVSDGRDWLRRMRPAYEWYEFLEQLTADRVQRVTTGQGDLVHPQQIMIPTPERRATTIKKDVDSRVPTLLPLAAAEEIMAYRPIDVVDRITPRPLLIVAVEDDPVTPTQHAVDLYERAGPPKKLIIQRHTTHYAAYRQYGKTIIPQMVDWFRTHLSTTRIRAVEATTGKEEHMVIKEIA